MDATEFWKLIDKTREASGGDPSKQTELLVDALAQLPVDDILKFDNLLTDVALATRAAIIASSARAAFDNFLTEVAIATSVSSGAGGQKRRGGRSL